MVFDGIVFGGKAKGVKSDGEEDVIAVHTLFPGDDVHGGKGPGMAHMKALTGGVGELDQSVELWLVGLVLGGKDLFLLPAFLPFWLNGAEIIFIHGITLSFVMMENGNIIKEKEGNCKGGTGIDCFLPG